MELKTDSRKIQHGDTFIAIKKYNNDGHKYIKEAIKNGAKKIIAEHGKYEVETVIVKDTTQYLNEYIYNKYYDEIKKIKLIGITGTSGKTTTSFLTYSILKELGCKVAYIGTIGFYIKNTIKKINNTTPFIDELYKYIKECKENNIEYIVMEISSHALDQDRIYGLQFDAAGFTNISQEHLDYHKTIENYAKTKQKLFKKLRNKKTAVINIDDKYSNMFTLPENNNITISTRKGDIIIYDIKLNNTGIEFKFKYKEKEYKKKINMVGDYNIYNYITSVILVNNFGYDIEDILKINVKAPKGRMELVKYGTNSIFVDYAHKPDAVKKVLENTLKFKKGKIITIIGCGGNRDKNKRPIMGKIASENSDYVIFTNDNPRDEEPKKIINDILEGVKKQNYEIILDRKKAIKKGISLLKQNDILLVLGKGHEDYQIIKGKKYHLDDMEIIKKIIHK
jgi:UDP-N-acetylmuramoyl-L-alanyl-D-glutamate--2,6-diaminopimelate ligase